MCAADLWLGCQHVPGTLRLSWLYLGGFQHCSATHRHWTHFPAWLLNAVSEQASPAHGAEGSRCRYSVLAPHPHLQAPEGPWASALALSIQLQRSTSVNIKINIYYNINNRFNKKIRKERKKDGREGRREERRKEQKKSHFKMEWAQAASTWRERS